MLLTRLIRTAIATLRESPFVMLELSAAAWVRLGGFCVLLGGEPHVTEMAKPGKANTGIFRHSDQTRE
jgi:hypothetical protein